MTYALIIPAGDLRLDPTPEGKSVLVLYKGSDFVRQKIIARFQFFLGEWFLDTRLGIPYYRDMVGTDPDFAVIRSIFRKVLQSIPEIATIDKLTVSLDVDRNLSVEFDANLVAGGVLEIRQPDLPFIIRLTRTT